MNFSDYMPNTIMNMFGSGGLSGKEYLMAQTPRNVLLDSMSPEVAGMFQQQYGINPMVDPMKNVAATGTGLDPMSALSYLGGMQQLGLLNTESVRGPQISQMPQATPGYQYTPVDLYKGGLLGGLV